MAALLAAGVERVIDVRHLPLTRKKDFSKNRLAATLGEAAITYDHRPRLGTPKPLRDAYHADGDFDAFAAAYEEHLATVGEAVAGLAATALDERVALLCSERDAGQCHRSLLARRLAPLGFEAVHL